MSAIGRSDPVRVAQRTALATLAEFAVTIHFGPMQQHGMMACVLWQDPMTGPQSVGKAIDEPDLRESVMPGVLLKWLIKDVTAANERVGRAVWAALIYGLGDGTEETT